MTPTLPPINLSVYHNLAYWSRLLSNSSTASYYQNERSLKRKIFVYLIQILNSIQYIWLLPPWNTLLLWFPWAHSLYGHTVNNSFDGSSFYLTSKFRGIQVWFWGSLSCWCSTISISWDLNVTFALMTPTWVSPVHTSPLCCRF